MANEIKNLTDSEMAGKTGPGKKYGLYLAIAIIVAVAIKALLG